MRPRTATLFLAAVLAFLALPLALQAAPGNAGLNPGDVLHTPKLLARYLRLTPDQVKTTQQLFSTLHNTVEPLRATQKTLDDALKTALQASSPNACSVGDAALAAYDNRQKIKAAYEDFDTKFSAILTPEQLAKYNALKQLVGDDS
ncbi:MAG TPA: periplasmic heavy metal sensor [Thermoanaerobaculia bacterium]|nr:periplasmic heavy metal sensor [Thermoanaerobaculia bacterium]